MVQVYHKNLILYPSLVPAYIAYTTFSLDAEEVRNH